MCSLCRLPVVKNHNFWQILTFGGSCTDPLLRPNLVCKSRPKFYTYTANFMGICWLSVAKNLNFWQILTFGGSCTAPFYRRGPDLVCCCRPMVYAYVPKFVSIGLFCRPLAAKNPNFCIFWISAFSGVECRQLAAI